MKKNRKGFTLAELLIVVAIIGVLSAIAIPVFTNQLEKSREATDLSNVRSAYAEVSLAAMEENEAAISSVNGSSIYQDGTYKLIVDLKQTKEGWATKEEQLTIGGIQHTDSHWINDPSGNGSCEIYYEDGEMYLKWDGQKQEESYAKYSAIGLSLKGIGSGYFRGDSTELKDSEKELLRKLQETLGYDEITVAYGQSSPYKNEKGQYLMMVSVIEKYVEESSKTIDYSKEAKTTRYFFDKETGELEVIWEQPGSWGTSNGTQGFWGSVGNQTVVYQSENVTKVY